MYQLPEQVHTALRRLHDAGFEAFLVGGCVRDCLMGIPPHDFDITTSALPEQTQQIFSDTRVILTGLKHGTVTVLFDGLPLEITTYRLESRYSDHRHPDTVVFTRNLHDDLARRDFTVNAMAWDGCGEVVDYFDGRQDLAAGIIRCVGDPKQRFEEDALRILRAIRFSSVLGFSLDDATARAAQDARRLLHEVSAERICEELLKLLCGKNVRSVLCEYTDILGAVIPELLPMRDFDQHNIHHIHTVLEHTAVAVESAPQEPVLRLAALLHDIGKPSCFTLDENGVGHFYGHAKVGTAIAEIVLKRLRLDNETQRKVLQLVQWHDRLIEESEKAVKRALNRLTPEGFFRLLSLKRADNLAQNPAYHGRQHYYDRLEKMARTILGQAQCFSLKDLAVNGSDLIALGMRPGPQLGAALDRLLDAVINGELPNNRDALLCAARFNNKYKTD